MTNDEQYVPSEDDVRIAYVDEWVAQSDFLTRHQEREAERAGEAAWDRFLARVRRDAWTEGCRAAEQYYRRTVVGIPGLDPIPAPVNPHEETP